MLSMRIVTLISNYLLSPRKSPISVWGSISILASLAKRQAYDVHEFTCASAIGLNPMRSINRISHMCMKRFVRYLGA